MANLNQENIQNNIKQCIIEYAKNTKKLRRCMSKKQYHTVSIGIPSILKKDTVLFFEAFKDSIKLIKIFNTLIWLVYKNDGSVCIAQATIAKMVGATRTYVNKVIGFLCDIGFIKKFCINDIYETLEYEVDELFYINSVKSWAWKYIPNILKLHLICSPEYVLPGGQLTPICSNVTLYKGEKLRRRAIFNKITSTLLTFDSQVSEISIYDQFDVLNIYGTR